MSSDQFEEKQLDCSKLSLAGHMFELTKSSEKNKKVYTKLILLMRYYLTKLYL